MTAMNLAINAMPTMAKQGGTPPLDCDETGFFVKHLLYWTVVDLG